MESGSQYPNTLNITIIGISVFRFVQIMHCLGWRRAFLSPPPVLTRDDVQVGYSDRGSWQRHRVNPFSQIGDGGDGAVTLDISRSWDEEVESGGAVYTEQHQLNLLADATEGRLVGWSLITSRT